MPLRTKADIARTEETLRAMRKPMPNLGLYQNPGTGAWYVGEDNERACRMIGRVWSEDDGKAILLAMGKRIKAAKRRK